MASAVRTTQRRALLVSQESKSIAASLLGRLLGLRFVATSSSVKFPEQHLFSSGSQPAN